MTLEASGLSLEMIQETGPEWDTNPEYCWVPQSCEAMAWIARSLCNKQVCITSPNCSGASEPYQDPEASSVRPGSKEDRRPEDEVAPSLSLTVPEAVQRLTFHSPRMKLLFTEVRIFRKQFSKSKHSKKPEKPPAIALNAVGK